MSAPFTKKARGLYTAQNRYDVPEGALIQASNVLLLRDGVIQPRWAKAVDVSDMRYSSGSARVDFWHRTEMYNDEQFMAGLEYNTASPSYYVGYKDSGLSAGAPTVLDTGVEPPCGVADYLGGTNLYCFDLEFLNVGRNLYYTSFYGVRRFDSLAASRPVGNLPCAVSCYPRPTLLGAGALVRSSNVVTATWPYAHGFVVGLTVALTVSTDANFPTGTFTIATVPSTTTFTYAETAANATSASSSTLAVAQFVGSNGFITTNEQVAYRACLVEYDANGIEHVGMVSARSEVINAAPFIGTGTNKNIQGAILFPASAYSLSGGLVQKTKFQIYRSKKGTAAPGDELGLVFERYLTDTERAQGFAWWTDITPDTLRGRSCYTNEGQEGLDNNNLPPPASKTMALWNDRTAVANVYGPSTIESQLLSTDSSSGGLASGDTFIIDGSGFGTNTYTASDTNVNSATKFLRSSGGTASQDVKQTVHALIDTINWGFGASTTTPMSVFYGGYLSVANDFPGRFFISVNNSRPEMFESDDAVTFSRVLLGSNRTPWAAQLGGFLTTSAAPARATNVTTLTFTSGGTVFKVGETVTVYTSAANRYAATPASIGGTTLTGTVLTASATTVTISNSGSDGTSATTNCLVFSQAPTFNPNIYKNRVIVSKVREFEAFPAFNYVPVGTDGNQILKMAPANDSLLVFTTEGLFKLRTSGTDFVVECMDPAAILWSRDSVKRYKKQVIAWLKDGVALMDDTAIKYVSEPIKDLLYNNGTLAILENDPMSSRAFSFVYVPDSLYELRIPFGFSAPSGQAPLYATTSVIYNVTNDSWVTDTIPAIAETSYAGKRRLMQGDSYGLFVQHTGNFGYDRVLNCSMSFGLPWTPIGNRQYRVTVPDASITGNDQTPAVGWIMAAGVGTFPAVQIVAATDNGTSWTLTFQAFDDEDLSANTSASGQFLPFQSKVEWAPITFTQESELKSLEAALLFFGVAQLRYATVSIYSEIIKTPESQTVTNFSGQGADSLATTKIWGWKPSNLRALVPQSFRIAQQISVLFSSYNNLPWTLLGIGAVGEKVGTRLSRQ